jgi:8-oxo-dGTP pyrophosphatase MutT (NUDIX family)
MDFAQKAVIRDGDNILMVRKSLDDPHNPGRWDLPGGRRKGREDLDTHITREVLEETGLRVTPVEDEKPIHLWEWWMTWNGEEVYVIAVSRYCELTSRDTSDLQLEHDDYLSEMRWIPRGELLSLDVIPSQLPTINKVVRDKSCHEALRSS